MMHISFIIPSWKYFTDPFKLQPMNELYYTTVLDKHFQENGTNVKFDVIDMRETRRDRSKDIDKISLFVEERDIFLYWIAKTADYGEVESIVKQLRKAYPKSKHIAGGTHVQTFPQDSAAFFDAVVTNAGETAFMNAIKDFMAGRLQKIYHVDWKDEDFCKYPFMDRSYLPEHVIVNTDLFKMYGEERGTSFLFSRGCSYKCAFCVYNVPDTMQRRTSKQIEDEISTVKKKYGIRGVNLRDEICIPLSKKEAIPFLETMGRTDIIWRGQTRVDVKEDVFKLAMESGCVELAMGAESASQVVLDSINKKQKVEDTRRCFEICRKYGIKTKMCLILGLPGEPHDIVQKTIDFIEELKPDFVNISGLDPVPGSVMFRNPGDFGIQNIDSDWSKHAHLVYRFAEEEEFGLPFEYGHENKWGKTFSRSQIIGNIKTVQDYLRQREMSY